ncbi:Zn-dependent protease with chaperone function [Kribbella amoyensis]|uniref:Zn-dependent protease with chaperone function n=1 Tax=Kribbella amoyensis TaxID=996641 RepID=A0A561BW21_9ACTN|nr:hypothetical protein [Kribbella amoyensis]TWD83086.1 Zn-dependent protease with chaperone function [Kribbella amoyensis]
MSGVDGAPNQPERRPHEPGDDRPQEYRPPHTPQQPDSAPYPEAKPGAPGGGGLLASEIANALAWTATSFLIIYWFTQLFGAEGSTWIFILLWLASGAALVWPNAEVLAGRYLLGLRQPTMVESQRLTPSWYALAGRAGIDPRSRLLWIQNSESATAAAMGGRPVGITGWAMYTLPPGHLEAVMAFSLASSLRGHTWLSRLAMWYSLPARVVTYGIKKLLKLSRTVPAVGCTLVGFLLLSYIGIILFALVFYDSLSVPLQFLSPLVLPLVFAMLSHWNERMADRAVADLGYGRQLLEVFYGWQAQHQETSRRLGLAQPEWLGGQSSVSERIRALETYAQRF